MDEYKLRVILSAIVGHIKQWHGSFQLCIALA